MNETYQEVQERIARMRQNGATKPQTDYVMSQWFNSKNAETLKKKDNPEVNPLLTTEELASGQDSPENSQAFTLDTPATSSESVVASSYGLDDERASYFIDAWRRGASVDELSVYAEELRNIVPEYFVNGEPLSAENAGIVNTISDAYADETRKFFEDNFRVLEYLDVSIGNTEKSYEAEKKRVLDEYGGLQGGAKGLIQEIIDEYGLFTEEGQLHLMMGVAGKKKDQWGNDTLLEGEERMSAKAGNRLWKKSPNTSDTFAYRPGNYLYDLYEMDGPIQHAGLVDAILDASGMITHGEEEGPSEALSYLQRKIQENVSDVVLGTLDEDKKIDSKYLGELETYLFDNFDIGLDLDKDLNFRSQDEGGISQFGSGVKKAFGHLFWNTTAIGVDGILAGDRLLGLWFGDVNRESSSLISLARHLDEKKEDLEKIMEIPYVSTSELFEAGDWDGGAAQALTQFGESVPMLGAIIITGLLSRNPKAQVGLSRALFTRASMNAGGVASIMGAVSAYGNARNEPWFNELNAIERFGYISSYGVAEGLPAMVGMNIFNRARLAATVYSKSGRSFVSSWTRGVLLGSPLGALEEGVTEAVTGGWQYTSEIAARQAGGDETAHWNERDYWHSVKEGWYAGAVMGGTMAGGGATLSGATYATVLGISSVPALHSKLVIKRLNRAFNESNSKTVKAKILTRIEAVVRTAESNKKARIEFYERMSKDNPADYQEVTSIQNQLAFLAMGYSKASNAAAKTKISKEMNSLIKKRSEIEGKYEKAYNLDTKTERKRILEETADMDKNWGNYGELFQEGDAVTVTESNVDSILDTIERLTEEDVLTDEGLDLALSAQQILSGEKQTQGTVSDVITGLKNVMRVVKAFNKLGGMAEVTIHKTKESFSKATGGNLSRGMWMRKRGGKRAIHIYAPMVLKHTGYHEAFHDMLFNTFGKEAYDAAREKGATVKEANVAKKLARVQIMTGLALELAKGIEPNSVLGRKLLQFLNLSKQSLLKKGEEFSPYKTLEEAINDDEAIAEEFLTEILGYLSSKEASVEVKKGLLDRFGAFLSPLLEGLGIVDSNKVTSGVKLEDLASAINNVTDQLSDGDSVTSWEALESAARAFSPGVDGKAASLAQGGVKSPEEQAETSKRKQIIGENAKLSEEIKFNLFAAIKMEDSGSFNVKRIRLATGWERGTDSKWRYELDDSTISVELPRTKKTLGKWEDVAQDWQGSYLMENFLIHPELYNAYPELLKQLVTVVEVDGQGILGASFSLKTGNFEIEVGNRSVVDLASLEHEFKHVLLHEVQHWIQQKEGFSEGGNFDFAKLSFNTEEKKHFLYLAKKINAIEAKGRKVDLSTVLEKMALINEIENLQYSVYEKIAGEIESRNVQTRVDLTARQRRATPLFSTEDVSREDQIFIKTTDILDASGNPTGSMNAEINRPSEGISRKFQAIGEKINEAKAELKKLGEAEHSKDKRGEPSYSKKFWTEWDALRDEVKRLTLLKENKAPAFERREEIVSELDKLNDPFKREVGNKTYPRKGTVKKGKKISENDDLGGIYETEVDGFLFRGVSLADYRRIQEEGSITTDLRSVISEKEGINLSSNASTAFNYLPDQDVEGVVMAIRISDKSSLFMIGADDYVRSSKPIPFSDVKHVTTPSLGGVYTTIKDGVAGKLDLISPEVRQQAIGPIDISSKEAFLENEIQAALRGEGTFAHMSAENPGNATLSDKENARRNSEMKKVLDETGYVYKEVPGKYNRDEKSFFVKGISIADAMKLGAHFDQESVSHSVGMLYSTGENAGKMEPITGEVLTDPDMDNFYTIMETEDGPQKYSIGYDWGNYVSIPTEITDSKAQSLADSMKDAVNNNDITEEVKAQGDLVVLIANMLDSEEFSRKIKTDKRRKNPVIITSEKEEHAFFVKNKKEVIDLLVGTGLSKELAVNIFNKAKAYKRGRITGKKTAYNRAKRTIASAMKSLSRSGKKLRQELMDLKEKTETIDDFITQAMQVVNTRMGAGGKSEFTRAQIVSLFKILKAINKVSPKRIRVDKDGVAQQMIDRLSIIFDAQDAKKALAEHIALIKEARAIQAKLAKKVKPRKKGRALKSVAAYLRAVELLSNINVALLPVEQVQAFVETLKDAMESTSKIRTTRVNGELTVIQPNRTSAADLEEKARTFQLEEEMGRNSVLVTRAQRAVEKARKEGKETTFEEEYDKLVNKYEKGRLTVSKDAVDKFIKKWNEENQNDQLDPANPADLQRVIEMMSEAKNLLSKETSETIIDESILPRVAANLLKLVTDEDIASILGISREEDFDAAALKARLMGVDKWMLVNLEYRLDSFIMNDSIFGLGYLSAIITGRMELTNRVNSLVDKYGIKAAKAKVYLSFMDDVTHYFLNIFSVENKHHAKIRVATGYADLTAAFTQADAHHALVALAISTEMERIRAEGGSIETRFDQAIMQIFSMARQSPVVKQGQQGRSDAQWYNNLKDTMQRSIDSFEEQKSQYSKDDIKQLRDAYSYLFGDTENLAALVEKVTGERSDITQMVDFVVDLHKAAEPMFTSYVARFLGKELTLEESYTAFDVRTKKGVDPDALINNMREGLMKDMTSAALSSTKKTAGASYSRNPHSLSGQRNLIGLDFLKINERVLRENTILSTTLGSVISLQEVFSSQAMERLIPDNDKRTTLKALILGEVHQDSSSAPVGFGRYWMIGGRKVPNVLSWIKDAVVVKLFGSVFTQTFKQSTVLIDAMAQFDNTIESVSFLTTTLAEMISYSAQNVIKDGVKTDAKKVFIGKDGDGKWSLLKRSPVFNRDYEKGNIDPYTGHIETNLSKLERLRNTTKDWSLLNLKSTDKVVAVASWLAYYGDYLISEGQVEGFTDINWEKEGVTPSMEAIAHADSMVTKDQSASTARQASSMFKSSPGFGGVVFNFYRATVLPFARFAISKKRAVNSDLRKLFLGETTKAKLEAGRALGGSFVSLSMFNMIGQSLPVLFQSIAASLGFGDDEEYEVAWKKRITNTFANTFKDLIPLPPLKAIEDSTLQVFDAFLYWSSTWNDGDPSYVEGESFLEGYERWRTLNQGVTIYGEKDMDGLKKILHGGLGPYGDYIIEMENTIENLVTPGNKIITLSGKERYLRPEDKATMEMFFMMKLGLMMAELSGIGIKELTYLNKTLDDGPSGRAFNQEEELHMYMILAQEMSGGDPYFLEAIKHMDTNEGVDRFMKHLMKEGNVSEFDALRAARRLGASAKPIVAESTLRTTFGMQDYNKYIRTIKGIFRSTQNAKDYAILMADKKERLSPSDFNKLKKMTDLYIGILSPGRFTEAEYYNISE